MTHVAATPRMRGVYLIHIENGTHYIGYADDVDARIETHENTMCTPPTPEELQAAELAGEHASWHQKGDGARFMGVTNYRGLKWTVSRVWWGKGRDFESHIKHKWGSRRKLCPECLGAQALNRLKG